MTDLSQKRELHNQARELLDTPAFTEAILSLRKRWFNELMAAQPGDVNLASLGRQQEIISRLRALEAIPTELALLINDYKMELKRQSNG